MTIDETRSKLLEAAGNEFSEKGFERATVRAICDRAGVNVAAVNYHFGDKERLYEEVVILAHHEQPDKSFDSDRADPLEALRNYVSYFIQRVVMRHEKPWHQEVMMREMAWPTKASDTLVREEFRPNFEALMAILGRLCPEADERRIHAIGLSVVGQCLHYKLCGAVSERIIGPEAFKKLDANYLTDHITRFTLAALGHGEPFATTKPVNASHDPSHETERGDR